MLLCLEISHRTARRHVRERLSAQRLAATLNPVLATASESALVNTCGRFEIYARLTLAPAVCTFSERCAAGLGLALHDAALRQHVGPAALAHLARVAAGLESPILGEDEVLGQVQRAWRTAREGKSTGPVLNKLFAAAIRAGKRVRAEVGLHHAVRSYGGRAVDELLSRRPGAQRVLVLGTGVVAADVLTALAPTPHVRPVVISKHVVRRERLAQRFAAEHADRDALPAELTAADALIGCTASATPIVSPPILVGARSDLLLIDLGVPANIALPHAACFERVGLEHFADQGGAAPDAIARAEAIINEEVNRFARWRTAREAARPDCAA